MAKNTFLAIVLSLVVLVSWQLIAIKLYPIDNKIVTTNNLPRESLSGLPETSPGVPAVVRPEHTELGVLETPRYILNFVNPGAQLKSAYFKDYNLNFEINGGLSSKLYEDRIYTLQKSNGKLSFSSGQNGHFIFKKLTTTNHDYVTQLEIVYQNNTSVDWTLNERLILVALAGKFNPNESRLWEVVILDQGPGLRKNPLQVKNLFSQPAQDGLFAFRNRYSAIIIKALDSQAGAAYYIEKENENIAIGIEFKNIIIAPNSQQVYRYTVYCGPQDANILKTVGLGFEEVMHFGSSNFIANLLLSILGLFHSLAHNWGLALILLSFFIFLILYPLTLKQLRSMKQMQLLQPQIEALRKAHKDNPQRLNKEIMELYRRHKANPLGGCLPLILQLPIFLGLYQALSRSVELKGAGFLWIQDLAEPDHLFKFSVDLPVVGRYFNLLPILMALAMFAQQKLSLRSSPTSTDALAEQQKMMLVLFPVMFGFIFYNFPSGLTLYWLINTALSTISQWKNLKKTSLADQG